MTDERVFACRQEAALAGLSGGGEETVGHDFATAGEEGVGDGLGGDAFVFRCGGVGGKGMQGNAVGDAAADSSGSGDVDAGRVGRQEAEEGQDGFAPQDGVRADLSDGEGVGGGFPREGEGNGQPVESAPDVFQPSAVGQQCEGIGGKAQFPRPSGGHEAVPVDGIFVDGLVGSHDGLLSKMKVFCQDERRPKPGRGGGVPAISPNWGGQGWKPKGERVAGVRVREDSFSRAERMSEGVGLEAR